MTNTIDPTSAQDVIADQIEGEVIGSGWDVSATRDQANAMARRAVKALETLGYAVVELPEPVHRCDRDAAWITPDGEVYQVDFDRRNGIWVSDRTTTTGQTFGPVLPRHAREVANALFAAAAHAEYVEP